MNVAAYKSNAISTSNSTVSEGKNTSSFSTVGFISEKPMHMKKTIQFVALILIGSALLMSCLGDHLNMTPVEKGTPPTAKHKTIAVLGMLANVNYDLITTSEAALNANTLKINDALKSSADLRSYIGNDWQVVWGPVTSNSLKKKTTGAVSALDSFVTDNTMYLAKGTNLATGKPMYVAATSGTNIVSEKGWKLEDFDVLKEADWEVPNSGKISEGSMIGLTILNSMKDTKTGQTLLQFLGSQPDINTTEVAFTGHSLGGALSPLMALKCIEWKEKMGYTTPVSAYPVAGPTSGDRQFASYAAQKFGDNYHSVINNYDIVPNSWQKDMFARIPAMYVSSPPFNPGGQQGFTLPTSYKVAYTLTKDVIDLKTYQRISPDKEYVFNGSANVYPNKDGSFFKEAGYQHVKAYFSDGFQFPQPVINVITSLISN